MRINVSIELRRPARRSLALVLGALLLLTPAVVLASHQFSDVNDSTPFHKEIGAIAKAGITGGFAGNQYRPSEPVTRQAMAAFMERGFGRVGLASGTAPITPQLVVPAGSPGNASFFVPVRELTITVPGTSNAFAPNQLVYVQARVIFSTPMGVNTSNGCPCEFFALIADMSTYQFSPVSYDMFESSSSTPWSYNFDVEALFTASPGSHKYQVQVGLFSRATYGQEGTYHFSARSSLSAMTFPFGPTGGNTASAPGAQNEPADGAQLPERRRDE